MHGNIGHQEAIELAETTSKKFNMEDVDVKTLMQCRTIKLKEGTSFLVERPLDDKENDNSCAITYYEIGHQNGDLHQKVKQKLIIHFLNEPFYN